MQPTFDQVYPVLYKGWGRTEAQADFNAGGWKNKGPEAQQFMGVQNPQDYGNNAITQAVDKFQKANEEYQKRAGEYQKNNPWSYDEYLKGTATKMAEEQQGINTPGTYYNETLSDYLLGVGRKMQRSASDTQDLVGELQATSKSFSDNTKLALDEALNKSREGFADAGLFDSGSRYRQEGLLNRGAGDTLANNQRQTDYRIGEANKSNQRTTEDYGVGNYTLGGNPDLVSGLLSRQDIRGTTNAAKTDVSNLASQLTRESGQQYVRGFNQTLPPELQANQGYDMLKQIGIY